MVTLAIRPYYLAKKDEYINSGLGGIDVGYVRPNPYTLREMGLTCPALDGILHNLVSRPQ